MSSLKVEISQLLCCTCFLLLCIGFMFLLQVLIGSPDNLSPSFVIARLIISLVLLLQKTVENCQNRSRFGVIYSNTLHLYLHFFSTNLRWPNTVLARAFADANWHVHKDFKKQTCRQHSDHYIYSTSALSVLFFSIIACSVLMALVLYYNDMLQKVTMQRTQHF